MVRFLVGVTVVSMVGLSLLVRVMNGQTQSTPVTIGPNIADICPPLVGVTQDYTLTWTRAGFRCAYR